MPDTALGFRRQIGGQAAYIDFAVTSGDRYFVDSSTGASTNTGRTPSNAFATVAQALSACTASKGDIIYVMPGHTESIGASGLAWNVAGVTIQGLGIGANRPTFTWHTTDALVTCSAANMTFRNFRCVCDVDEVVKLFLVTGAKNTFDAVDFIETTSCQAIQFLLTTSGGVDLTIQNCNHVQVTAAGSAQAWIGLTGADRAKIIDNHFQLLLNDSATSAVVRVITTACVNVLIARNLIWLKGYTANLVSAFLSTNSTTGLVADNRIGTNVAANTTINDMPGCYSFNNLCTNAIDTSGIVDPVVDT